MSQCNAPAQAEGFRAVLDERALDEEVRLAVESSLGRTPLEYATQYWERGFAPIPIPFKTKRPKLKGWQRMKLEYDELQSHFDEDKQNVGVVLGDMSGGLLDIDLDCPEAIELARTFL